jgi:ADP-ribosylglycohydrolase
MNCIKSGIIGQIVGDALGLPVQFIPRPERDISPVTGMIGYGAFRLPPGSWSDDSSLILATIDGLSKSLNNVDSCEVLSLNEIIDYEIIMKNFSNWFNEGEFTPYGYAYDIGRATREGIERYDNGCEAIKSGGIGERDNGNGSLMRILPIAFFIYYLSQKYSFDEHDKLEAVHNLSSLTHRHKRSQLCCGIYVNIALELIENHENENNLTLEELVTNGIEKSIEYYSNEPSFEGELHHFDRVFSLNVQNLPRDEIKSGGYTISTLEASIWCLLNNENYKDTVLEAVNLGNDTDTTACVVGGLAGIYYGYDDIPSDWINQLARLDYIEELIDDFHLTLSENH